MVGEEAPSTYIARGWAIGMFWGCSAPFGIQLMLSIPCAFILRGSKIGATLGTFGGAKLLGIPLSYDDIKKAMVEVIEKQNFETLFALGTDVAYSFFAGGLAMALVFTPITYFAVKSIVDKYRAKKGEKNNS